MMPRLVPKQTVNSHMIWLSPVIAVLLTLVFGMLLFMLMGQPPVKAIISFFITPLQDSFGVSEWLVKASPLIMIAIGLAIGFRANVWNIGAEGQLVLGALAGGAFAVYFPASENVLMLPAMLIAGVLGGMFWAAIPAYLKMHFNCNEILTSLMLTYVAVLLLSTLVHGPWRDPDGYNFPESVLFPAVGSVPVLWTNTRLHLGAAVTLLVVVIAWVMLSRLLIGFQVKVAGLAPRAAQYAGINANKIVWFVLLLGGGLAGLAGIIEVAGPIGQLLPTISPGYGFTAIIVAFLGRLHPVGIVLAGLILALSYLGGENVQIELGMPQGVAGVFQGMLLFFLLACDVLVNYRVEFGTRVAKMG